MRPAVVVGGGLVGLATAWALSRRGVPVVVLEKERSWASHQSGRNSGVVHSGLYYEPGSLKATMAVAAVDELARFCAEHDVPYRRTGKLVAATSDSELPRLRALADRGRANGVPVRELGRAEAWELEPEVDCRAGLWVESTGVCDFPALARRLAELLEERGADLRLGTEVLGVRPSGDGAQVLARDPAGTTAVIEASSVATCAGLQSDRLARGSGLNGSLDLRIVPFRGEYFELRPEAAHLVRGLIYPVPDPELPFLGVHLTRGIDGHVHVGPNAVPALAREGYRWRDVSAPDVMESLRYPGTWRLAARHARYGVGEVARSLVPALFVKAVQRMVPAVTAADLVRAPAGVRAQAVRRDGSLCHDFELRQSGPVLHVVNAPSPAATASLLIGERVADALGR